MPNNRRRYSVTNRTGPPKTFATNSIPTLLWWDSVYNSVDDIRTCNGLKCRVTNNKDLKHDPSAKVSKKGDKRISHK